MNAFAVAAFSLGRRVCSELYDGRIGTIVKVRMPAGLEIQISYDIAWDDGSGVEKVAQSLLQGPTWKVLPQVLPPEQVEALRLAFLTSKLQARSEQARARLEAVGRAGAPRPTDVAFYRPSDTYARTGIFKPAADQHDAKLAAKALRIEFQRHYEGVRFAVTTKADVVHVSWVDGPVYVTPITDRFACGRAVPGAPGPQAGRIAARREMSDQMIESAIEYVRQVIGEPLTGIDAAWFRNGSLRDMYPRSSSAHSGLSIGRLARVVMLRWDDYVRRFVSEGPTRAMLLENEALFPGKDMAMANDRMRVIRASIGELHAQSSAFDELGDKHVHEREV